MTIMRRTATVISAAGALLCAASVAAQGPAPVLDAARQREQRYPIGMMERVLESAVEHGATVTRDRLQALIPAEMLLGENARARGFPLAGFGVFFDVIVPPLRGTLPWSFRTLDQNDLGLDDALKSLRSFIGQKGSLDLQQALRRLELQVAPLSGTMSPLDPGMSQTGAVAVAGLPAASPAESRRASQADPILNDPEAAYRVEVISALMNAMLDYSRGLNIGANEWLMVGARRDESPRTALTDSDARTIQIRVRGDDLNAFLSGRVSREEARDRMEVSVF